MATINREKLERILLEQNITDLLAIWFAILEEDKHLLIGKILEASDFELSQALQSSVNWDFHVEG